MKMLVLSPDLSYSLYKYSTLRGDNFVWEKALIRKLVINVVMIVVLVTLLAFPGGRARAYRLVGDTWNIRACPDGLTVSATAIVSINGDGFTHSVVGANPGITSTGNILSVPNDQLGTFSGSFSSGWSSAPTVGTPVDVQINIVDRGSPGGTTITESTTVQDCSAGSGGNGGGGSSNGRVEIYNPNDGRVEGGPGDRVVVWCNLKAKVPSIDVWGIASNSRGFKLATFSIAAIKRAKAKGLTRRINRNNIVSISVDANGRYFASWYGGAHGANGLKPFVKSFVCPPLQ
jgi:hypothetical protein